MILVEPAQNAPSLASIGVLSSRTTKLQEIQTMTNVPRFKFLLSEAIELQLVDRCFEGTKIPNTYSWFQAQCTTVNCCCKMFAVLSRYMFQVTRCY